MAAWKDSNTWNNASFNGYKEFVATQAPSYKGSTEDCADLSIKLLIDYAAGRYLPVSFWSTWDVLYSSRAAHQWPGVWPPNTLGLSWSDKKSFYDAVKRRIDSKSLLEKNTNPVDNCADVWTGDLMLKGDHTAIVFAVYQPGEVHRFLQRADIPDFPGPDIAASELDVLEYFRTARTLRGSSRSIPPPELNKVHIDYLNHRGEAFPPTASKKQKAELIYFADAQEMVTTLKFSYRRFSYVRVLNNWPNWNGEVLPLR
jgi:hypothetical protein